MEPDRARYPLHIKTVQGSSLKGLFEVLKELLNDVNVVVNQSGIKILAMDSAQVTLCHCLLEAQNFEVFHCPETVVIGLNVQNLYKLLKTVSSQDTLTLQIESDSPNDLEIIIQNSEKKSKTFFKLRLLDIDDDRLKVPNVEMTTCITMASVDFQRLIRDMLTVGSVLRVRVKKREVIFETSGDFASQRTILETSEDTKVNESDDEIDLSFSLKLLSLFSKASTLSTTCSLWLQADFPLIVQEMGTIDDVQFLLENSVEETYLFIVDSGTRDRTIYPEPNLYAVTFDSPFQNVIGIDIIDGTIPRTQYAVDTACNKLCIDYGTGPVTVELTTGDHTDTSLVSDVNARLAALPGCTVTARSVSTPPELKNLITFTAPNIPFHIIADERSTVKPVLGFDEYAARHKYLGDRFACKDPLNAPAIYTSVAKDPMPATTFSTQESAEDVISFADPSSPTTRRLIAIRFSPTQSGLIDSITLACNVVAPSSGTVTFYLASDDEVESAPGAPICPPVSMPAREFGDYGRTTLRFSSEMGLTVGRNAWLVVSGGRASDGLYAGSSGNALAKASSDGGGSWSTIPGGLIPLMSVQVIQSTQTITGPGILNLVGDSYCMLRCDEIESHTIRSRAFEKYTFGLARFTLAVVGFAQSHVQRVL
ncbi:hypothetical protein KFL_006770030 [Klebsormidium nitens]|uniref:DNA sliding clamp PCNA n=1 Tax=Klebsormidium nitens TaxID=105231 RepID=A0A1Y1IIK7_KLENI|nr:hypothetical protein KFL_006770030 [Klebsormidium nitens]|eukprot:GAQ90710.1 hypothetical protein KFL_006770030 [Klebsormidium nitens]